MDSNFERRRRGRPPHHPIRYLMGMVWFAELSRGLGCLDANEVSEKLFGRKDHSNMLARYSDGRRGLAKYGPETIMEKANQNWPGSAAIVQTPFWRVLMKEEISADEAIAAIGRLGDPVAAIILAGGYLRDKSSVDQMLDELSGIPSWETLEALVLLLAWADRIENHMFWNRICDFYRYMIPDFMHYEKIPHYQRIFDAIDEIARQRQFSGLNCRADVFESWRDQIPRYEKILAERELEYLSNAKLIVGKACPGSKSDLERRSKLAAEVPESSAGEDGRP